MKAIRLLICVGLLAGAGCGKEPLKMPPTEPGPAPKATGPSAEEQAARAALEKMGGKFHKEVAFGMPGMRIELPQAAGDAEVKSAVPHLKAFPKIDELDLSETKVTSAGLTELKALKNLRLLAVPDNLMGNPILREIGEANPGDFSVRGQLRPVGDPPKK